MQGSSNALPVHKIMAVSAPSDVYHLAAHFPGHIPWETDPFCQEFFLHGGVACHRWRFNRTYSEQTLKAGDYIPGSLWMDVLLEILPKWPLSEYKLRAPPDSGVPLVLIQALLSPECHLLERLDYVDGERCAVFDIKGLVLLWIATDKGLCLIRREARDPFSKRLIQRVVTDKVTQIAPGLWLPTQYRIEFMGASHGESDPEVRRANKIRILRCVVNDGVPEDTFVPVHLPGSLKYSDAEHFTQVCPGGEDLLSDFVTFMRKYAKLPRMPGALSHSFIRLVVGFGVGLCAGLLLRCYQRTELRRNRN